MSELDKYKLSKMKLPQDIKKLSYSQCNKVCEEIRELLIDTVSQNGGHLASNLGTVELSVAIHRVFNSPKDKIVWDVGHQSYTHKILTGRLNEFSTLRKENGISGFCRPEESCHDAFISGHSSTAVSAALGIATAMKLNHDSHHAIAVVGDGAASGGEFFEGLNNAGKSDTNIIVILNYNEMSISKNVGGLAKYLSTFRTKHSYIKVKRDVEHTLDRTPLVGKPLKNVISASKNAFKNILLHSTMFEDFGFEYVGPIDGHDIKSLEEGLKTARDMHKPVFVHVNTIKGKGYVPAEENPGEYHGIGSFEISTGNPDVVASDSFSTVFGLELNQLAENDDRIVAVTAAMKYGTGLQYFHKSHPERFFDVGIAEQHAVTFCGGLASMGKIPVFAVYSSFLQRAYDQVIHDLAITRTHAVIAVDRAGLVGNDGETHQGIFDVSILTSVPGISIYSPSCYEELRMCIKTAIYDEEHLVAVRYPRGCDNSSFDKDNLNVNFALDDNGGDILIITYGRLYNNTSRAVEIIRNHDIKCDVLRLVKIFPIEEEIVEIISRYKAVFFFEESYCCGSISEKYSSICPNLMPFAIGGFVKHASVCEMFDKLGLLAEDMADKIREVL